MESEPTAEPAVLDVLQRLWQTKMNSIALIERWLKETADTEIRAGLAGQLVDERIHLRLIGEQIRRFGGKFAAGLNRNTLTRLFQDAQEDSSDVHRLFALHRSIKAFTVDRCGHIIPMVDSTLASVIDRITRDEERHIRWADIRLERLLTRDNMRECNLLVGRMRSALESTWGRSWKQFSLAVGLRSA